MQCKSEIQGRIDRLIDDGRVVRIGGWRSIDYNFPIAKREAIAKDYGGRRIRGEGYVNMGLGCHTYNRRSGGRDIGLG